MGGRDEQRFLESPVLRVEEFIRGISWNGSTEFEPYKDSLFSKIIRYFLLSMHVGNSVSFIVYFAEVPSCCNVSNSQTLGVVLSAAMLTVTGANFIHLVTCGLTSVHFLFILVYNIMNPINIFEAALVGNNVSAAGASLTLVSSVISLWLYFYSICTMSGFILENYGQDLQSPKIFFAVLYYIVYFITLVSQIVAAVIMLAFIVMGRVSTVYCMIEKSNSDITIDYGYSTVNYPQCAANNASTLTSTYSTADGGTVDQYCGVKYLCCTWNRY